MISQAPVIHYPPHSARLRDYRIPGWAIVWFAVSGLIQAYDALFVLLKPMSGAGGSLGFLWPGHQLYATYDLRYAAFDAFGSAQSWLNLVEVLAIVWVLLHARRFSGVIGALIVSVATFWKTVLYFMVEICSGLEKTRHALEQGDMVGFLAVAVLPNLFWIVVPFILIVTLCRQLLRIGRATNLSAPA